MLVLSLLLAAAVPECHLEAPRLEQLRVKVPAVEGEQIALAEARATLTPTADGTRVAVRAGLVFEGLLTTPPGIRLARRLSLGAGAVEVDGGASIDVGVKDGALSGVIAGRDLSVRTALRCEDLTLSTEAPHGREGATARPKTDGTLWSPRARSIVLYPSAKAAAGLDLGVSGWVHFPRAGADGERYQVVYDDGAVHVVGWVQAAELTRYEPKGGGGLGMLGGGGAPVCADRLPAKGERRARATIAQGTRVLASPGGAEWARVETTSPIVVRFVLGEEAWVAIEEVPGITSAVAGGCFRQLRHAWVERSAVKVVEELAASKDTGRDGAPLDRVSQVAAGELGSCAVRDDGGVWCWGRVASASSVAKKVALPAAAAEVAAGSGFACARSARGKVWCWGQVSRYDFGRPGAKESPPLEIEGLPPAAHLTAGDRHACALTASGEVWCFGDGQHGQRGVVSPKAKAPSTDFADLLSGSGAGAGADRRPQKLPERPAGALPPTRIEKLPPVVELAAGSEHTLARTASGDVWAWGHTGASDRVRDVPSVVAGKARAIAARGGRSCALLEGDEVSCAIGDTFGGRLAAKIPGARRLSATSGGACAGTERGDVWCFGDGFGGKKGPSSTEREPTRIDALRSVIELTSGGAHTCALGSDREVRCFGVGTDGQLGTGSRDAADRPVTAALPDDVVHLALGEGHGCALRRGGRVTCFGDDERAGAAPAIDDAVDLAAGRGFTCAVRRTGALVCWGAVPSEAPKVDDGVEVAAGPGHACVRRKTGALVCFGRNDEGQTGPQGGPVSLEDALSGDAPAPGRSLALGAEHTCVRLATRKLACFGRDESYGQGGARPRIRERPADVVALAAGARHTCAVLASGKVACFGRSDHGQIGRGGETLTGVDDAVAVVAGEEHTCLLRKDGTVACLGAVTARYRPWARLPSGQVLLDFGPMPVPIRGLDDVVELSSGPNVVCARERSGRVACFGDGSGGLIPRGPETGLTPVLRESAP